VTHFETLSLQFPEIFLASTTLAIIRILFRVAGTALVIVGIEEKKVMKTTKQLLLSLATVLMALTTINCGGGSSGSSNTTAATPAAYGASCGTNMLTSQYGCLPQCGASAVTYNNTCTQITTAYGTNGYYGGGIPGQSGYGYGYGTGNPAICQGTCPAGLVSFNGGTACMPQQQCGACYAQMGQYCYIGDYAHQYYGY
jgi:hypothetical protein